MKRQLRAAFVLRDGKEVSCPILKIDTFMVPAPSKIVGQMEMRSMTLLTILVPAENGRMTIGAISAEQCKVLSEISDDNAEWISFT